MKLRFLLLMIFAVFSFGCNGAHAIDCFNAGEQKLCFVREVWGLNGDKAALTTDDNVCHKPSKDYDYISNYLRGSDRIFYKVKDGKLYIYAENMDKPEKDFPVEVILEAYDPFRDVKPEGYNPADLSLKKMTWCVRDIF